VSSRIVVEVLGLFKSHALRKEPTADFYRLASLATRSPVLAGSLHAKGYLLVLPGLRVQMRDD